MCYNDYIMPRKVPVSKEVVELLKLKPLGDSPRIQLRIPKELLKRINKEIKATHEDCSHVVRSALWEYFERRENAER